MEIRRNPFSIVFHCLQCNYTVKYCVFIKKSLIWAINCPNSRYFLMMEGRQEIFQFPVKLAIFLAFGCEILCFSSKFYRKSCILVQNLSISIYFCRPYIDKKSAKSTINCRFSEIFCLILLQICVFWANSV